MNDTEKKWAANFIRYHKRCKPKGQVDDKDFIYNTTPTGIGVCIEIKCPYCGRSKDITDIDSW